MNNTIKRIKTIILSLMFFSLHGVEFVRETAIINPGPVMKYSGVILILLSVVLLIPNVKNHFFYMRLTAIKSNPLRAVIVTLWFLLVFFASFSEGDYFWLVTYIFLFGFLFLIRLNGDEKDMLINAFFWGNAIGFIVMQSFAYGFRPYDEVRYKGPFANPNITGLYYTLMYSFVLFFIHYLKKKGTRLIYIFLSAIVASYLIVLIFMTVGRAALLTVVFETILFLIVVVWRNWKWKAVNTLLCGVWILFMLVIAFLPTYATVRYFPGILHHPIWFINEYSETKVHSFDPITSDKYVSVDELLRMFLGRNVKGFVSEDTYSSIVDSNFSVNKVSEESTNEKTVIKAQDAIVEHIVYEQGSVLQRLDRFSSGRVMIIDAYIRNLNFSGHSRQQEIWMNDEQIFNTQNIFLQVTWDYGISAGIVFVILTILLWIYHIKSYIKNKEIPYSILPIMVMFVFYVFGQLEVVWEYGMIVLWMFFFVQHPVFTEPLED